jgi:leucyl aminopeptidase
MELILSTDSLPDADVLLILADESSKSLGEPLASINEKLNNGLSTLISSGEFKGKIGETASIHGLGLVPFKKVTLLGLGKIEHLDRQRAYAVVHQSLQSIRKANNKTVTLTATPTLSSSCNWLSEVAAISCILAQFEQKSYKSDGESYPQLESVHLAYGLNNLDQGKIGEAKVVGNYVNLARRWVNEPSNHLTPERFAEQVATYADQLGLKYEVFGPEQMNRMGMGALLGVAKGSRQEPRLVKIIYNGGGNSTLGFIGKGVTFDTGGISIKPAAHMEAMKGDMAGAAAVLSSVLCIAELKIPANIIAVAPLTENMPGGNAQKPGDVVTSLSGKTIEIINTDAEGRLILADATTYAIRNGATHLIDLATLTGAARYITGYFATPAITTDEKFFEMVKKAGDLAGERIWLLPNYVDYEPLLESKIADIRNSDYGQAGTIMGGMFIQQFTEGKPWVHLDIAYTADNDSPESKTVMQGPSGMGVRTLVNLAKLMSGSS